ncbi:pilus assembly FimT family protein [Thermodesulfobacterium hydrogeniphilum]|uniref:pilus assembly FimT family protein n=1 Tax=Thermodesulfobacterium hydrogeniphilum TaxID=161156 RepID=UPI000571CB26|nr:GspH/FimT family pseudopilin [Thermodesulfobacterium hydrogeniphilum]
MRERYSGITIVELFLVIAIMVIIASIAIPSLQRFFKINKYFNDVIKIEYSINKAKMMAMERTTNIGVCIENNELKLYDTGYERGNNPCIGTLIFVVKPEDKHTQIISNGTIIFDPRGLNISSGGNICIPNSNLNVYYRIIVGQGYLKTEKGEGTCL